MPDAPRVMVSTALLDHDSLLKRIVEAAQYVTNAQACVLRLSDPAGNIDNHLSNIGFAAVNLVDSASAATCGKRTRPPVSAATSSLFCYRTSQTCPPSNVWWNASLDGCGSLTSLTVTGSS